MRGERENHLQTHLPAKREQSVTCSVHLSTCAAGRRNTRGSDGEETMCDEKMQRKRLCRGRPRNVPRGGFGVNTSPPPEHQTHCSNGLFAKWTMLEFISLSSLFCYKYLSLDTSEHCCRLWSLQNMFLFHLRWLLFVSAALLCRRSLLL